MGEKRAFQERARINSPEQIQGEIKKIYRGLVTGKIAPAKAKSRIDVLTALLRAGGDEKVAKDVGTVNYQILPIASGKACDELTATGQLPEDATFELFEPTQPAHIGQRDDIEPKRLTGPLDNIISLRPYASSREALEARLAALPDRLLLALAGVPDDEVEES